MAVASSPLAPLADMSTDRVVTILNPSRIAHGECMDLETRTGPLPAIEVIRRATRIEPLNDRRLRTLISTGTWIKIVPGAFAPADHWRALTPIEQHRLRVHEVIRRLRAPAVVSHFAAAAVLGIDVLGCWPATVDLSRPPARGGRSTGLIRRRTRDLSHVETTPFGGHRLTSPAQTALDLARSVAFTAGVAIVDQAIWTGRRGGALTTRDEILRLWEASRADRGHARALRAISFANPLAANVRESQSRVVIAQLGFPAPVLQERRVLRSGRLVFGDFFFAGHDHWGELDGYGKYVAPEFNGHRTAVEHVIAEKDRENEIRREVRGFSRWTPADVDAPERLYDILTGDGLPSALPRPRGGA